MNKVKNIKIVALSDIHGNLLKPNEIPECDVVCICGDICPLEYQRNFAKCVSWFCLDFFPWTNKLKCDKVIFIAGNHDFFLERLYKDKTRTPSEILKCLLVGNHKAESKIIYLQDNSYEYKGVRFYGTPWIKGLENWAFNLSDCELENRFKQIPKRVDVLMTHSPSTLFDTGRVLDYNTKLRISSDGKSFDFGSYELAEAIQNRNIKYAICGHVHSGSHEGGIIGKTIIKNVSLLDENYKVAYEPSIILL